MPGPDDLTPDDIPKDFKGPSASPTIAVSNDDGPQTGAGLQTNPQISSPSPGGDAGFTVGQAAPKPQNPTVQLGGNNLESGLQDSPKPAEPIESGVGGDKDKDEAGEKGEVKTKDQAKPPKRKEQGTLEMQDKDFGKATEQGSKAGVVALQNIGAGLKQFKETMDNNGGGTAGVKEALKETFGFSEGANNLFNKVKNALTGGKPDGPSTPEMKVESSAPAPTSSTGEDAKSVAVDPKKDGPEPSPASDATKGPLANVDKDANDQSKSSFDLRPHPASPGAADSTTFAADNAANKKKEQDAAAKTKDKEPAPDTKPPVDPGGTKLGM